MFGIGEWIGLTVEKGCSGFNVACSPKVSYTGDLHDLQCGGGTFKRKVLVRRVHRSSEDLSLGPWLSSGFLSS